MTSPLDVPVRLLRGKRETAATLRSVDNRGLVVKTDDPPPLRQLVKIELSMPHDAAIFTSHATVVRVAEAEGSNHVGLELFGQDRKGLDAWEVLVRFAQSAPAAARDAVPVSERAPSEERRRNPRFNARLEMRVRSPRNIHVAFTRDLSQGGCFMEGGADLQLGAGEPLVLNIVRPESRASVRVTGSARHQRAIGSGFGYGIAFDPMPVEIEQQMLDFVTSAVEFLEQQAKSQSLPPGRPSTG